ncbi:BPI fold-containing family C protein-like [Mixophyes fleayi]|uniref:BPI fold-containing family C protein-like n=1 Tax=Mixophyes fleayi TaxID=3061075 RepID=UPI003F4E1D17
MLWFTAITSILLSLSGMSYSDNPGIKIRVTENALDRGVKNLINDMISQNKEYQLPDSGGSTIIASEEMKYEFTNMRMVHFNSTNISATWVPETGLKITMQDGSATINCNWKIESSLIKDSGSSVLTLTGISLSVVLLVHRSDTGMPSVFVLDCQSDVQGTDFKMIGGVSYVYDALRQPIENLVRTNFNQQLCSSIKSEVKKWEQSLSHLNLNLTLSPFIDIDMSLVGNPEISDQYADIDLKGRFYTRNQTETAFSPTPIMLPVQEEPMIYVGISESSINSLCDAYYTAGSLNLKLTHMAGSQRITTSELSVYIPEISQRFPNPAPVKIQISATRPPRVYLKSNNMTVDFYGLIQTYACPPKARTQRLFGVKIVARFNANFSLSDAKGGPGFNLTGSSSLIRLQMDESPSDTKLPKGVTKEGVKKLLKEVAVPAVNEKMTQGIYIPGTMLENPSINIKEGFAMVAAGLKGASSNV